MATLARASGVRVRAAGAAAWRSVTPWGRRLLVAMAAAFVLASVVAVYLPRQVERHVWRSELETDRAILSGLVSSVDVPPRTPDELRTLDAFAHGALLQGDYVRVKLWDVNGTILYSDDATLIGRRFPIEGGLGTAIAGAPSDQVSRFDRVENERERGLANRALEVYVPVEHSGEVVAVWEVYRSLDRFDAAMARIRRAVGISVGGALALLLLLVGGLVGTLLRSLQRRGADAMALSGQLGTLLSVAKETSRSLNTGQLAQAAVDVIRSEAGFEGVALLRGPPSSRDVVAVSTTAECPGACLLEGSVGVVHHDTGCTTLGVEVPAGDHDLLLTACRPSSAPFTDADGIVLRAAGESVAMAWDNARLYEQLARSQATQRQLTRRLVDAHEDERRSVVGDIHDGLGQDLHRVLFSVRRARARPEDAGVELARLEGLVEASIGELRRLLRSMRPTTLEDLGLVPAIRSLVASVNDDGGILVDLRADGVPELDVSGRLAVYRIVQEALHNAVKHGHAEHAIVDVGLDAGDLVARVEDDGVGYEGAGSDGLGVWLMRERAEAVGGRFDIHRIAPGTAVEARIPVGMSR